MFLPVQPLHHLLGSSLEVILLADNSDQHIVSQLEAFVMLPLTKVGMLLVYPRPHTDHASWPGSPWRSPFFSLHCYVMCTKYKSILHAAKYDKDILAHIEPFVYEWTASKKGSISAEHGLGQMKPECIR